MQVTNTKQKKMQFCQLRTCLNGGGGSQIAEVTCGGSPHLSRKRDQIKMRDYVNRQVTHQSGLPHLPGVPHLHVNRPLVNLFWEHHSSEQVLMVFNCALC